MNRRNHTRLIGLNDLRIAARNDFSLCRRDNIDPPKYRPEHSGGEDCQNGPEDCTPDGRGWSLLNFQDCRHEFSGPSAWGCTELCAGLSLPSRFPDQPMSREFAECHASFPNPLPLTFHGCHAILM